MLVCSQGNASSCGLYRCYLWRGVCDHLLPQTNSSPVATSVLAEDQEDTDLTRSTKTKVLAYLKEKYNDLSVQELLDVVTFLDPRFKTQYITADNIPTTKTRLKTKMLESARCAYNQVNNNNYVSMISQTVLEGI